MHIVMCLVILEQNMEISEFKISQKSLIKLQTRFNGGYYSGSTHLRSTKQNIFRNLKSTQLKTHPHFTQTFQVYHQKCAVRVLFHCLDYTKKKENFPQISSLLKVWGLDIPLQKFVLKTFGLFFVDHGSHRWAFKCVIPIQ